MENGVYPINSDAPFMPTSNSWQYPQEFDPEFYSQNISGATRLPNGNTLICEGGSGHLFEVMPNEEMVWSYVSPITAFGPTTQGSDPGNTSVFRTYRYVKNTNDKRLGNKLSDKQKKEIKEDEKFLNEKNEANLNTTAETTGQVAVRTKSKIADLEIKPDEIIEQNYEKFIKGEIDLDQTLDLGLNVNSFRQLSKDGINQVQAITKSLSEIFEFIS